MKIAGFRLTRAGSSSNLPVSGSMIHTDGYPRRKIRMLNEKTIAFIGVGNMGEALISGLLANGSARPEQIICTDANPAKRDAIGAKYGVQTMAENVGAVRAADIVVYAVKPQILAKVLRETADELDMRKLVISIAAGVPLAAIESCLEKKLRLIRVMPNICAFVGESATAVAGGDNASPEDIQVAMAIFDAVGKTVFIGENYLMDAITGLSGSGPAYIFMIVDAMADAGVKMGLARTPCFFPPRLSWAPPSCSLSPRSIPANSRTGSRLRAVRPSPVFTRWKRAVCAPPSSMRWKPPRREHGNWARSAFSILPTAAHANPADSEASHAN
jgi:pyrroline-5-carboxylate reductase